jgi:ABC-type oligopeptide transport system substrate-binding subunit
MQVGARSERQGDPRVPLLLALLVALVLAATGPGAAAQARSAPQPGGVYRRPLSNEPATLDPARVRDIYSLTVVQQIFEPSSGRPRGTG